MTINQVRTKLDFESKKNDQSPDFPMTVSGCTQKSDPQMSAETLSQLQKELSEAKSEQKKAKGKAKAEKKEVPDEKPKTAAKTKAKSKPAPKKKSKNDDDGDKSDNPLDSEESLTSGELPPESEEEQESDTQKKARVLSCLLI